MGWPKGETVTVIREVRVGTLPGNTPDYERLETVVENVLIDPSPGSDVTETHRPDGTRLEYRLHFPKTFTGTLRGAEVIVRGGNPLFVEGDPQPYTNENTPGPWNRPVDVFTVKG
ncbi:hypothetical protein ACTXJU_03550 [Glutamicibacter ardleyensis]|uniref:hypothetical protein n=1 Tax=Glutamicibacter ardleyensis TaxID=225894 RepID=UPI003FD0598B